MPGQISIVGFSGFISRIFTVEAAVSAAEVEINREPVLPWFSDLSLVVSRWQNPAHENIYPTNHNSARNRHRGTLICASIGLVARWCIEPGCRLRKRSDRPAKPAGDDETNDGAVEVE